MTYDNLFFIRTLYNTKKNKKKKIKKIKINLNPGCVFNFKKKNIFFYNMKENKNVLFLLLYMKKYFFFK